MAEGRRGDWWMCGFSWLLALPMIVILYVLSIGPVVCIAEKTGINQKPLRTFYMPVVWLHEETPLREPLDKWGELWGWN
ncbi:hypothetical protein Mal4_49320 [Maioricimonas rarisocia]|uniref:Uncharacterized protein n=1 Tax=Maioricimonas rarisocia TaxID=2528026 RepID=A0A517ZDL9_9PLAN|nr:hypothetical protein [Maioricimonas rarisocia]QDU40574.1 hypothetical protein Mal4_49320 [Maioricimonas rarisocia]